LAAEIERSDLQPVWRGAGVGCVIIVWGRKCWKTKHFRPQTAIMTGHPTATPPQKINTPALFPQPSFEIPATANSHTRAPRRGTSKTP
jgi:hypothetical protein